MRIGGFIAGAVVLLVGVSLLKPLSEELSLVSEGTSNQFIFQAVPVFFGLSVLGIAVALVFKSLRGYDFEDTLGDYEVSTEKIEGIDTASMIKVEKAKMKAREKKEKEEYKSHYSEGNTKFDGEGV